MSKQMEWNRLHNPYIYLSYAQKDTEFAAGLAEMLMTDGFRIWFNPDQHDTDETGVENAYIFLLIYTEDYLLSEACMNAYLGARRLHHHIIIIDLAHDPDLIYEIDSRNCLRVIGKRDDPKDIINVPQMLICRNYNAELTGENYCPQSHAHIVYQPFDRTIANANQMLENMHGSEDNDEETDPELIEQLGLMNLTPKAQKILVKLLYGGLEEYIGKLVNDRLNEDQRKELIRICESDDDEESVRFFEANIPDLTDMVNNARELCCQDIKDRLTWTHASLFLDYSIVTDTEDICLSIDETHMDGLIQAFMKLGSKYKELQEDDKAYKAFRNAVYLLEEKLNSTGTLQSREELLNAYHSYYYVSKRSDLTRIDVNLIQRMIAVMEKKQAEGSVEKKDFIFYTYLSKTVNDWSRYDSEAIGYLKIIYMKEYGF